MAVLGGGAVSYERGTPVLSPQSYPGWVDQRSVPGEMGDGVADEQALSGRDLRRFCAAVPRRTRI